METVKAEFDGSVFVPCEKVELPVGTQVDVVLPIPPRAAVQGGIPWPPGVGEMSPRQLQEWEEIRKQLEASEPYFPTVEEALRHTRKRP